MKVPVLSFCFFGALVDHGDTNKAQGAAPVPMHTTPPPQPNQRLAGHAINMQETAATRNLAVSDTSAKRSVYGYRHAYSSNAPFGNSVVGSTTSTLGIDDRHCLSIGGVPTAPCVAVAIAVAVAVAVAAWKHRCVVSVVRGAALALGVATGAPPRLGGTGRGTLGAVHRLGRGRA